MKTNTLVGTTRRLLLGTLLAYALLVSTHLGEFWPFSIYPMFSRGGHDWSRAIVRDLSDSPGSVRWDPVSIDALPGKAFALDDQGINQNDIANFVAKADDWSPRRIAAMRKVFGTSLGSRNLLLFRAEGRLAQDRTVSVKFIPFVLMNPGDTVFNPSLDINFEPEARP
jgi:hypothetical protein